VIERRDYRLGLKRHSLELSMYIVVSISLIIYMLDLVKPVKLFGGQLLVLLSLINIMMQLIDSKKQTRRPRSTLMGLTQLFMWHIKWLLTDSVALAMIPQILSNQSMGSGESIEICLL
jgi:hypothetical protein